MTISNRVYLIIISCFLCLSQVDFVFAQISEVALTPGVAGSDKFHDVDNNFILTVELEPGRSYACTAQGETSFEGPNFKTEVAVLGGDPISGRLIGHMTPHISGPGFTVAQRISVTSPNSEIPFGSRYQFSFETSGVEPARLRCIETSLYGGFNTNASPINFLEVINTSNLEINIVVTATDREGATLLTGVKRIEAGGRADIDIHSHVGPTNYGSLKITHDGSFGSLTAHLAEYSSDLILRGRTELKTRPREDE